MAKVDDLQTSFDQLNGVVRAFLGSQQARIGELEAARDALLADETVEDNKLEGMIAAIDGLRADVESASGSVPTPVDPTPVEPPAETPVEQKPDEPVI